MTRVNGHGPEKDSREVDASQVHGGMHVQPCPLTTLVKTLTGPGGVQMNALQVEHPTGSSIYLLDPDHAIRLGEMLIQQGRQAKTGLIVPG